MNKGDQRLDKSPDSEYVALLPAAGIGSRLPGRDSSKELLPFRDGSKDDRPVISHVLSCIQQAGIDNVIVVLRHGKQDIYDYLTSKEWQHINFVFKFTPGTSGVPETVALGLDEFQAQRILFGFPDILFEPRDAYIKLMRRLESTGADVVLGLFPTNSPGKMDMVDVNDDGHVSGIEIKPERTTLALTWILAAWQPSFSTYLCDLVQDNPARIAKLAANPGGSHLGHVFQLAMADGMLINSMSFEHGRSLDIGTPDDLHVASNWLDRND
ncbi:MAG: NTP transferase domain-containing protein [Proteobacteria bacterium]|nr:NTP transferase domain-containing protein [Pseudomonadota bacterium]